MHGDDPCSSRPAPIPADALADFSLRLRSLQRLEWVDEVRRDQANRWRSGQRILLEDYFQCCPELTQNEEDTLVLIVGEAILRRKLGDEPTLEDYQRRFPQMAARIGLQFQLDRLWPSVAADATQRIVCPVCHNEIENSEPGITEEMVCPSCGSSFRLERHATLDWHRSDKPRRLGKYELIEPVGVGTFGTVYKARDSELDRTVAIKVPRVVPSTAKDDIARFLREARSVAQLRHPGIVSVHEIGQSDETPYLVSEFVQGTTLTDLLLSRRPAPREAAELVATLADALHYAHEMGVVHRDVKPANIMLDEKGAPRLMDFGLARRDAGEVTMTIEGQVLGTPAYMSPEQARGESRNVDGRSDVYSLGVILYQLLTGELPFRGTTRMLLNQVLNEEPRRPRSLSHLVPRDLETICLKAMAKDALRRYATARDLADDLRRFLAGEPIHARPVGGTERLWRWCRRKPALAGLIAAVGILLVAIAVGGSVAALQFRTQVEDATGELYFSRIAQANLLLTASSPNPRRAEDLLNACPLERRNWEWNYLKRLWRIEPVALRAAGSREFNGVAYSYDGRHLAAACGDGKVRVWDQKTGDVVELRGHDGFAFSVAFSPVQSGLLASAGSDGHVRVWDLSSGREMLSPLSGQKPKLANGMAYSVAFSPDGKWLAAASEDDTAQVWNATTGHPKYEHRLQGHEIRASCVAFSRDGRFLASGSWRGVVRLWDAHTGQILRRLHDPEHIHPVGCLAFSPDAPGQYLAAGYFGRQLDVWDTASGRIHRRLRGHTGIVTGLAFHPQDGGRLASSGQDRSVRIWDVSGEREALQLPYHTDNCNALAFSPNGLVLASASSDEQIRIWDATPVTSDERQDLCTLPLNHEVWSVAVSPDGTLVAAAGLGPNVRLWDAVSGREERTIQKQFMEAVFSLAFSPDSERLAAAGMDGDVPPYVVKIFDVQTGQSVLEYRESEASIFATALSPDGRWMALGLQDGFVKLVDVKTGQAIDVGKHDRPVAMGGVTFRHDGARLASIATDGTLVVWEVPAAVSAAPQAGEPAVPSIAKESGSLRTIWSENTGTAFWSVAFSPDGRQLVTGSIDGKLTLWDAETGWKIDPVERASRGEFLATRFTPNGRWILSASEDCTVRVLDATTLERIHTFRGHLGPIRCLAVSKDGTLLATGSADKSVKVWDLKPLEKNLNQ